MLSRKHHGNNISFPMVWMKWLPQNSSLLSRDRQINVFRPMECGTYDVKYFQYDLQKFFKPDKYPELQHKKWQSPWMTEGAEPPDLHNSVWKRQEKNFYYVEPKIKSLLQASALLIYVQNTTNQMEIWIIFHEMSSILPAAGPLRPDLYCIPHPGEMFPFFFLSQFDIDSFCKENPDLLFMAI